MKTYQRLFIFISLVTIILINAPLGLLPEKSILQQIRLPFQKLGALSGLDTRWEIFSKVDRYHYQLQFTAGQNGHQRIFLPGPSQNSNGTFWKNIFDFREENFFLNIFNQRSALDAYVAFLCKTKNDPILNVKFIISPFKLLTEIESMTYGAALMPMAPYLVKEQACH